MACDIVNHNGAAIEVIRKRHSLVNEQAWLIAVLA